MIVSSNIRDGTCWRYGKPPHAGYTPSKLRIIRHCARATPPVKLMVRLSTISMDVLYIERSSFKLSLAARLITVLANVRSSVRYIRLRRGRGARIYKPKDAPRRSLCFVGKPIIVAILKKGSRSQYGIRKSISLMSVAFKLLACVILFNFHNSREEQKKSKQHWVTHVSLISRSNLYPSTVVRAPLRHSRNLRLR